MGGSRVRSNVLLTHPLPRTQVSVAHTLTPLRTATRRPVWVPAFPLAAPPWVRWWFHWCHLYGIWEPGQRSPVCLVGSFRPSDLAMRFSSTGVLPSSSTSLQLKDASFLRAQITVILVKDVIEPVPPANMKTH